MIWFRYARHYIFFRATDTHVFNFQILKPFLFSIWLKFTLLLAAIGLLLKFVLRFENENIKSISILLLTLGIYCQQGAHHKTTLNATRFIISFLFFSSILTYNLYTSIVVSSLIDFKYESKIKYFNDLIESDIEIGFYDESKILQTMLKVNDWVRLRSIWLTLWYFQGAEEPENRRLVERKILNSGRSKSSFQYSMYEGMMRVRQGHFAFFCDDMKAYREIGKYFAPHEICDTMKILLRADDLAGIIVQKSSPLREVFLSNFLWLKEVGIHRKIHVHWNGRRHACTSLGHYESVRIEYVSSIFLFLFSTFFISFFLMIGEIVIRRWRRAVYWCLWSRKTSISWNLVYRQTGGQCSVVMQICKSNYNKPPIRTNDLWHFLLNMLKYQNKK